MATLSYVERSTLHGVRFRFSSQMQSTGMGLESESESVSVILNKYSKILILNFFMLSLNSILHVRVASDCLAACI